MARGTTIKIGGTEYWVVCNAEVNFKLREQLGEEAYKKILQPDREGFDATIRSAAIMLEQGELCRRYLGYDALKMPTEELLRMSLNSFDVIALKNKVLQAMTLDVIREVPDEGEVDLGLLELEKKTEITV